MILGALSLLRLRQSVPIRDDELATLDFEAARARNHLLGRTLRRARARFWDVMRFGWIFAFAYLLRWSPAGILAYLVYGAILTVVADCIRYGLASRWVHYSHARGYRSEEILSVCIAVERDHRKQRIAAIRPRPQLMVIVAAVLTLVVLPTVGVTMSKWGWVVWRDVLANPLMPFFMIVLGVWRLTGAVRESLSAAAAPVGSQDLLLESDDALDIYAGVLLLSWLAVVFGPKGLLLIAISVFLLRLAYRAYDWWWLREALPYLSGYAKRTSSGRTAAEVAKVAALADAYGEDPAVPSTEPRRQR